MGINIKFNGVKIPDFVKVKRIDDPLLPNIVVEKKKKTRFTDKIVTIEFDIHKFGLIDRDIAKELIHWAKGNNWEICNLELPNMTDATCYRAKLLNNIDWSESIRIGSGSLQFYCENPYKTDTTYTIVDIQNNTYRDINYHGDVPTNPVIIMSPMSAMQTSMTCNYTNTKGTFKIMVSGLFYISDSVVVDFETRRVLLNGSPMPESLNITSRFVPMQVGGNRFQFSSGVEGYVEYKNRYYY